jgi:hypothetical protein
MEPWARISPSAIIQQLSRSIFAQIYFRGFGYLSDIFILFSKFLSFCLRRISRDFALDFAANIEMHKSYKNTGHVPAKIDFDRKGSLSRNALIARQGQKHRLFNILFLLLTLEFPPNLIKIARSLFRGFR